MGERFLKFDATELHSTREVQISESLNNENEKSPQNVTSDGAQHKFDYHDFYIKRPHHSSNSYEISFQNGFMTQHSSTFQKKYQNYMEALRELSENPENLNLKLSGDIKIGPSKSCKQLIYVNQTNQDPFDIVRINQKLLKFEKINQYLDFVCECAEEDIAIQLIKVAFKTLGSYPNTMISDSPSSKLVQIGLQTAIDIINNQALSFKIKQNEIQLCKSYDELIKFHCVTVLLVAAQYFENPYLDVKQQLSPKRQLRFSDTSQCEQSSQMIPRKQRKYSF